MSFSDPFYTSDYFTYQAELLDLESEDPGEHERGLLQLTRMAGQGNTEVMLLLGRHFVRGRYRDAYLALKWYLEAMRHREQEGWGMLQRYYRHPDDEDMEQAVCRMEAEGYTMDALKQLWQSMREETL